MKPNTEKPEAPISKYNKNDLKIAILESRNKRLSKKLEDARILANVLNSKNCTKGYKELSLERLIKLLNE